jgi:uncharacterized protein
MLRRLGAVQLDTISVLARSHELVAYARLGPIGRPAVEAAFWKRPSSTPCTFEYWAHAACVLPMEDWPWFSPRRRRSRDRQAGHPVDAAVERAVRARLAEGPATATDLGGAKQGGPWWDWSAAKVAVERMLAAGEVACVERRGWRRIYDLAERVVPPDLLAREPTDGECAVELVRRAAGHLGVATAADLADYYRLLPATARAALADAGLVPVEVEGWGEGAWADPDTLAALSAGPVTGRHRTTFLSPFDSLVWDRARLLRVFRFHHRLEAYVPKEKRVHGYFVMPLLAGGHLVGRLDPARSGATLVARRLSLAGAGAVRPAAAALVEAAAWVGCEAVTVERLEPEELRAPLAEALAAEG